MRLRCGGCSRTARLGPGQHERSPESCERCCGDRVGGGTRDTDPGPGQCAGTEEQPDQLIGKDETRQLIYPDAVTVPRLRPDGVKPRVFLVDDHRGVLNRVSALLAHECDVVGTATDGRQALDAVRALDPDAIVLDINMPGLNGFQTMQALEQAQSRTPVVFLSLIDADEEIREAFRRGGRGYVVKTRMADDLSLIH